MLAFQESDDYTKNQWTLTSGTFMDSSIPADDEESLQIRAATNEASPQAVLFEVPFSAGDWHNFALALDFDKELVYPLNLVFLFLSRQCSNITTAPSRSSTLPTKKN